MRTAKRGVGENVSEGDARRSLIDLAVEKALVEHILNLRLVIKLGERRRGDYYIKKEQQRARRKKRRKWLIQRFEGVVERARKKKARKKGEEREKGDRSHS